MKRYKTKESLIKQNNSIPSIQNTSKNKKKNFKTNPDSNIKNINTNNKIVLQKLPKIKLTKNYNLSTDNLTLKAINDLSLFISNIPSIKEMKKSIEEYLKKNELNNKSTPIPYISQINMTTVRIDFPNEKILNGYKSYISFLKYENPSFKNILIKKENLFKVINNIKLKNISNLNTINNSNETDRIKNINANEKNEKTIIVKNIIKLYQHNKIKYNKDNASFNYNTLGLRKSSDNDKVILNYYKNQDYLRNSSPYLSEEDKRIISERESKKKFITPKGFCCSVGKYSCPPKFISNYVQMTPSENPSTYRFRPVNKLKWITKKGFINA